MSEERNQYAVVPFDTFERYLGPRYENIPGVECKFRPHSHTCTDF